MRELIDEFGMAIFEMVIIFVIVSIMSATFISITQMI